MRAPDETSFLSLRSGHRICVDRYGPPISPTSEVVLLVNGGPGLPCDYLRDAHLRLLERGFTVVAYDQLGCGRSDRPTDTSLWTLDRYVDELAQLCAMLELPRVQLLGHSWGTWLGTEFCLRHPQRVKSYIAADGACDIPHLVQELQRLRAALGSETATMMIRREAEGTIDHPEYQAAITLLNYRHVCRLEHWPESLQRSLANWNMGPYATLQGPNEFTYTGSMKDWNRIPAMHAIDVPCLVIAGQHDELTPACARKIHDALPNSRLAIFRHSSHMPFYEEPTAYFDVLIPFLNSQCGRRPAVDKVA